MKNFLILFLALSLATFGQEETEKKDKKDKKTNVFTDAGDAAKMKRIIQKILLYYITLVFVILI
jgi:hypothetical protein